MALDASSTEEARIALSAAGPIPNAVLYNNAKDLAAAMVAAGVTFGGAAVSDALPIGSVVTYTGTTIPTGYLDADGSSQLRSAYTDLFNLIGTTYGPGAVPGTTFALPDFTGTYTNFIIKTTPAASNTILISETLIAVPLGTLQLYAGTVYPTGWLRADGTAISRTTYADLFAILGTTYGVGDGSTTFNLPNLLSSGTPSPVYIIKVTLSGSVEPSTVAHAASHIRAGTDVIDGDRVQVDYVPSAYTRNAAATGAGAVTDLTAHLAGIDADKLRVGATAGGDLAGTYPNPVFASGILKIKQVLSVNYDTEFSTTSGSLQDTGLNLSITPSSTSSTIIVIATTPIRVDNSPNTGYYEAAGVVTLRRGSTNLQSHGVGGNEYEGGSKTYFSLSSFMYIDSPATTSAVNYKTMIKASAVQFRIYSNNLTVYGGVDLDLRRSQMILVEVL